MKSKPSPHLKWFMPLVLWRNDIEKIVGILDACGGNVEIVSSGYSFENLAELVEHFGVIHPLTNLEITGTKPHASIDLRRREARLYVAAEENGSGVFFELSEVLASRQRRWPLLYSYPLFWTIIWTIAPLNLFLSYTMYIGWVEFDSKAGLSILIVESLLVASLMLQIWVSRVYFIRSLRHAVVILKRHSEKTSFFQRKKDELALALIMLVLGTVLGSIGTKLADRIFKADLDTRQVVPPAQK